MPASSDSALLLAGRLRSLSDEALGELLSVREVRAVRLQGRRPGHRLVEATEVSAGALGMLAETLYAHGRPYAADEPLYLRSPDVTISAGPKRVTS